MSHHTHHGHRPTLFAVTQALHGVLRDWRKQIPNLPPDHDGALDVRLCVRDDDSWFLATGDVSYDTEHTPRCAAGTLYPSHTESEVIDLAMDLVSEIEEG